MNNTHGFSVPPIFLPHEEEAGGGKDGEVVVGGVKDDSSSLAHQLKEINQIHELIGSIDKA